MVLLHIEGIVFAGSLPEGHHLIPGEPTIRIMVSNDMESRTWKAIPDIQDHPIPFVGNTQISELNNKVRAFHIHGFNERT